MVFAPRRPGGQRRSTGLRPLIAPLAATIVLAAGCASDTGSSVFFVEPADGAVVSSPVSVLMGAEGFHIEPARMGVGENRGHFHIMIDAPCVEARLTVGADERHLHFGDGQITASLDLDPGTHTLCLQAADGEHTAVGIVHVISIEVEE